MRDKALSGNERRTKAKRREGGIKEGEGNSECQ